MSSNRATDSDFLAGMENADNYRDAFRVAQAEAWRARSEETRLLEENRKQAEQIKALADVLEHLHTRVLLSKQSAAMVEVALRSVGRLP